MPAWRGGTDRGQGATLPAAAPAWMHLPRQGGDPCLSLSLSPHLQGSRGCGWVGASPDTEVSMAPSPEPQARHSGGPPACPSLGGGGPLCQTPCCPGAWVPPARGGPGGLGASQHPGPPSLGCHGAPGSPPARGGSWGLRGHGAPQHWGPPSLGRAVRSWGSWGTPTPRSPQLREGRGMHGGLAGVC